MAKDKCIVCPECDRALRAEQVQGHMATHWGLIRPDPIRYPEAARRWKVLWDHAMGVGVLFQTPEIKL